MGKEGRPAGHQSGRGGCWEWRAGSGSGFGEHADEAGCLVAPPAPLTSRPRFWIGPFLIDHRHIWNVIHNETRNRCHPPTSLSIVPATKNHSHHWSSWHIIRRLQCAEQQDLSSNLTTYRACHVKWHAWLMPVGYETLLDWTVTWLHSTVTLLSCYCTDVLPHWTVPLLRCYLADLLLEVFFAWTVIWLNGYFPELSFFPPPPTQLFPYGAVLFRNS